MDGIGGNIKSHYYYQLSYYPTLFCKLLKLSTKYLLPSTLLMSMVLTYIYICRLINQNIYNKFNLKHLFSKLNVHLFILILWNKNITDILHAEWIISIFESPCYRLSRRFHRCCSRETADEAASIIGTRWHSRHVLGYVRYRDAVVTSRSTEYIFATVCREPSR